MAALMIGLTGLEMARLAVDRLHGETAVFAWGWPAFVSLRIDMPGFSPGTTPTTI